ncbi:hypothetical protein ACI77O_12705 [Pseudomonas tritici]|uniref:hypothetical protein n=1 Tax=Pseudomonas tritici TaxID=2745518 RepID=UPI00387B8B17
MSAYYLPLMALPVVVLEPGQYMTRSGERVTVEKVSSKHDNECIGFYTDSGTAERWHKSGRILATTETGNDLISRADSPRSRIVQPGGLTKELQELFRDAVKTSEVAHTCEWLVSEGYASDIAQARELVDGAFYE